MQPYYRSFDVTLVLLIPEKVPDFVKKLLDTVTEMPDSMKKIFNPVNEDQWPYEYEDDLCPLVKNPEPVSVKKILGDVCFPSNVVYQM